MNRNKIDFPLHHHLGASVVIAVLGRVAEVGSLSARAKKALKMFLKCVFTIFATNASFLRVIVNLQIYFYLVSCIHSVQ